MESDWLALTKLIPPDARPDRLLRTRLITTLQRALAAFPLILVSAPAGSGKTTLLASLVEETRGLRFAWVSLDEHDNDPARCFGAISVALQRCGLTDLMLLDGGALEQLRAWLNRLVNTLLTSDGEPVVLVLDDLHYVTDSTALALLDQLLERMPARLRLIVATRHDPPLSLPRLRVRRQVAEFHLDELRFTASEAETLLNTALLLDVSAPQLTHLMERTEGWAAGISLLASSLEQISSVADRAAFLDHVQRTDRAIFEFLAEEVLNRQDPFVRMFLLETAVLPNLTPTLCQAVTGRADAEAILDALYRRNLFLVEIRDKRFEIGHGNGYKLQPPTPHRLSSSYRYHDLFRTFLRERLRRELPEWPPRLYRRAAAAETDPALRIQLYLAGELWEEAARTIAETGSDFIQTGSFVLLQRWIDALPGAVREAHPQLLLLLGICKWEQYELAEGRVLFEQALRKFTAAGDQEGRAAALVQLARGANLTGDTTAVRDAIAQAATLPHESDLMVRQQVTPLFDLVMSGRWREVLADLDQLITTIEQNRQLESQQQLLAMLLPYAPGLLTALPGGMQRFERIVRLLEVQPQVDMSEQLRLYSIGAGIYCHFWHGNWDAAVAGCAELYRLGEALGVPAWRTIEVGALPPLCAAFRGDMATAEAELERLFYWINRIPETFTIQQVPYLYWRARLRWQQRRYDEVRAAAQRIAAIEQAQGRSPFLSTVQPLLRGLIALSERRFEDAERELYAAANIQEQVRFSVIFSDAQLLLAFLALKRGRANDALALFTPLLEEHAQADTPGRLMWEGAPAVELLRLAIEQGVHITFAERVLELLGAPQVPGSTSRVLLPDSDETLTEREIQVLGLIASGASNALIAEQLVISMHTAKRHVANILNKLGAASRTEAAARARELGLI
jgi:LuxR family transcriptional regulator, maltose regulon positive regulatory protein